MKKWRSSAVASWCLVAASIGAAIVACSSSSPPDDPDLPDTSTTATDASDVDADATLDVDAADRPDVVDAAPDSRRPWPDAPCPTIDAGLSASSPPATLSETGLYSDVGAKTIATGVRGFAPTYTLWSDGAVKTRWVSIPDGCAIDTSDMDHWVVPVGTKLWKEFAVEGKRIETRLVARIGPKRDDFLMVSYAWREDESDADVVPLGVANARGTNHDIPPSAHCVTCHQYLPEHVLGFGAIQLAKGTGLDLPTLVSENRLSHPPATPIAVPGSSVVSDALGYLHANCAHCHNQDGIPFKRPFSLRVSTKDALPVDTAAYKTAVNVPVERFLAGVSVRIKPGKPTESCVYVRPSLRTPDQMPPIATEVVDPDGLAKLDAWITSLPP